MKVSSLISLGALALVAFSAAAVPTASAKEWTTVTIALEGSYAPWNLTTPDGKLDGFEPDLAKVLCAKMNVQCKLIAQDWDGMMAGLQAGKFDVIMDSLSITDERKQQIDFSIPYANTPNGFVVPKSSPLANLPGTGTTVKLTGGPEDQATIDQLKSELKGKDLGVTISSSNDTFVEKYLKDVLTPHEYKASPDHDLDLVSGRIDIAFDDSTYFKAAMDKPENKDLVFTGPQLVGGPTFGPGEALGLRKSDTDLKAKFDEAIKSALADGTVKTLSLKWFKLDVSP